MRGRLGRLWRRLRRAPHLFAKGVILWCVGCATVFSLYALRILSRTGNDPAGVLRAVLAFFGGELLLLCLKTVLGGRK